MGCKLWRVNIDQQPALNKRYTLDGDYVSRVILMMLRKRSGVILSRSHGLPWECIRTEVMQWLKKTGLRFEIAQ